MGEGGFNIAEFWPIILMFALLYFMMIRPQQKRQKQQMQLLAGLAEGDEVATASGILGRIASISETVVKLEIAPDVTIQVQKATVTTLLPKGTLDNPNPTPDSLPPPSCCA
ncbi:MAG: preprotein translocase subunit YajC [Burkholderiaceae bacterium]|nr:preprotein translocase subunit YajC [Burkholderiaceae bacterium]